MQIILCVLLNTGPVEVDDKHSSVLMGPGLSLVPFQTLEVLMTLLQQTSVFLSLGFPLYCQLNNGF